MKKKIPAVVLTFVMIFLMLPAVVSAEEISYTVTGGDIYFDSSTGEITGCDEYITEAVIPSEIDGMAVTAIGESAFEDAIFLTSVELPEGVTSIGRWAFYGCDGLESVNIPESVTAIGQSAFDGCESLESIVIPDGVTTISSWAFFSCRSLESVYIPDSAAEIGSGVFSFCTSLQSINTGSQNVNYSSFDGVLFNKNGTELVQYPAGKEDETYEVPNGVTSIRDEAFAGSYNLTNAVISESVSEIGEGAFRGSAYLESVTLPYGLTEIKG